MRLRTFTLLALGAVWALAGNPLAADAPSAAMLLLTARAANAPAPLATPIPYAGQEMVHPSVFYREGGWNGFPYWMAATPYAHSDAGLENPSLYCSLDGLTWSVPKGIVNPMIPKPKAARRYNSDCHLAGDPDGSLHMFYRAAGGDGDDTLFVVSSRDGLNWSAPRTILDVPLADERQLSPAVFFDAGRWTMYYVDSSQFPYLIRMRTGPKPEGPWSAPRAVEGISAPPHKMLWHLDAFRYQGCTVLLVDTTEIYRTQDGGHLFFAVSSDGLRFTQAEHPVLAPSDGWDSSIYRSCCLPMPGGKAFSIWYSAWGPALGWRVGFTRLELSASPAKL